MEQKLRETLKRHQEEYLQHLMGFIACDTQVIGHGIQGGREKNGQVYLEKILATMGADIRKEPLSEAIIQQGIAQYGEGNPGHDYHDRYNLIAGFCGRKEGRSILFDGHVDTMPPGDPALWQTDPFVPTYQDGRIFGLGAADMKAGLMAAIMAVQLLQDAGIPLPGDVKIVSVVDEEGGGNGSIAAMLSGHRADAAVVCEPSENSIIIGHMGFIFFEVAVKGIALHSGSKWNGVNAIEKAIVLIQALQDLEHHWLMIYRHPLLPPPTLNIGVIEGGKAGSTVPDACSFKFCLHYLPNSMNHDSVVREVSEALLTRAKGDGWMKDNPPQISIYQAGGAFEISAAAPFVEVVKATVASATAREPVIAGATSGNDARILLNIGGMPTVVLGPGYLAQCHSPNEFVAVADYLNHILIYAQLIVNWGSMPH